MSFAELNSSDLSPSKLLTFAECIEYVQNTQEAMDDPGESFFDHIEGESGLFYSKRGWCPFCKIAAPKVYHNQESEGWDPEKEAPGFLENEWHVWLCSNCGWWDLLYDGRRWDELMGLHIRKVIRHGILKSFNVSDAELPVEILRSEIRKRPEVMYHIHPRKMEELVKSVFSDFYDCEVEHCGGPHDKGIDLIVIDSDSPIVVQVKRRSRKNKTESFAVVRDLLGAMGLSQKRRGIIVTTAEKFSKDAQDAARSALTINLVDYLELVNADRFLEILNLYSSVAVDYWKRFLPTKKSEQ